MSLITDKTKYCSGSGMVHHICFAYRERLEQYHFNGFLNQSTTVWHICKDSTYKWKHEIETIISETCKFRVWISIFSRLSLWNFAFCRVFDRIWGNGLYTFKIWLETHRKHIFLKLALSCRSYRTCLGLNMYYIYSILEYR